jgi:hypothetical protein
VETGKEGWAGAYTFPNLRSPNPSEKRKGEERRDDTYKKLVMNIGRTVEDLLFNLSARFARVDSTASPLVMAVS